MYVIYKIYSKSVNIWVCVLANYICAFSENMKFAQHTIHLQKYYIEHEKLCKPKRT